MPVTSDGTPSYLNDAATWIDLPDPHANYDDTQLSGRALDALSLAKAAAAKAQIAAWKAAGSPAR